MPLIPNWIKENPEPAYGIWNDVDERFVFGIREHSPAAALDKLLRKIGKLGYGWKFSVMVIPDGWRNPSNPHWKKLGHEARRSPCRAGQGERR